jgi:hypothetical protein
MAKKVSKFEDGNGDVGYFFHCEGCNGTHSIFVKGENVPNWSFNGNEEQPTFRPSIRVRWDEGEAQTKKMCHSFITDGKIQYLNDCTHNLKGRTVDLMDF